MDNSSSYLEKKGDFQFKIGDSKARLVMGDNFSFVEDSSVDMVLTDPPFNLARITNFHTYEKNTIHSMKFDEDGNWDTHDRDDFIMMLNEWSLEFNRVLRKGGTFAIFCSDDYLSHLKDALRRSGLSPKRTITWRKPNAVPVNRKYLMMSACEYILVGSKGSGATFNAQIEKPFERTIVENKQTVTNLVADKIGAVISEGLKKQLGRAELRRPEDLELALPAMIEEVLDDAVRRALKPLGELNSSLSVPNFIQGNSKTGKRLHPTEKPIELLQYLIELFSQAGDVLLDPFAGSGSLAEAALFSKRNSISVEQDADHYSKSVTRIQGLSQDTFFV